MLEKKHSESRVGPVQLVLGLELLIYVLLQNLYLVQYHNSFSNVQ